MQSELKHLEYTQNLAGKLESLKLIAMTLFCILGFIALCWLATHAERNLLIGLGIWTVLVFFFASIAYVSSLTRTKLSKGITVSTPSRIALCYRHYLVSVPEIEKAIYRDPHMYGSQIIFRLNDAINRKKRSEEDERIIAIERRLKKIRQFSDAVQANEPGYEPYSINFKKLRVAVPQV